MAFLEARGITKRYGAILANDQVSFTAEKGALTALLGENGAGKTTLARILAGEERPESGEVLLDGKPIGQTGRRLAASIGLVHQHTLLADGLTVAENIALGREPTLGPFLLDRKRMLMTAALAAGEFGFSINPEAPVRDLSPSEKQEAEILKVLSRGVEAIILDEPTSLLAREESESLYRLLRRLADSSKAVVIVTHRLRELGSRADRFVFLRDGRNSGESESFREEEAFQAMFGISDPERERSMPGKKAQDGTRREMSVARDEPFRGGFVDEERAGIADTILEAKGLGRGGLDFNLRSREILAFAALAGNGLEELERLLSGMESCPLGELALKGRDIGRMSTGKRRKLGMAYLPTDRMRFGLDRKATLAENLLALEGKEAFGFPGRKRKRLEEMAREKTTEFPFEGDLMRPAGNLSGGQMQYAVLARELSGSKPFILACNPTWGLDRIARARAIKALEAARSTGAGIILLSSDLEEALEAADRIIVLYRGGKAAEFHNGAETGLADEIARAMVGSA